MKFEFCLMADNELWILIHTTWFRSTYIHAHIFELKSIIKLHVTLLTNTQSHMPMSINTCNIFKNAIWRAYVLAKVSRGLWSYINLPKDAWNATTTYGSILKRIQTSPIMRTRMLPHYAYELTYQTHDHIYLGMQVRVHICLYITYALST